MTRFLSVAVAFAALAGGPLLSAAEPESVARFASYAEMREEVVRLTGEEKFAEAARLLEAALDAYPDRIRANSYNLAYVRLRLEEIEGALKALELGLSRGVWFGKLDFAADVWKPLRPLPRFQRIERKSESRRREAEKRVAPRLDVVVPPGTPPEARLPLFIALHGGGENVDLFRPHWTSPLLEKKFIVAFPQSTQLVAPDGFDWMQDVPRTLAELEAVHARLLRDYPVDPARVVVGGFSSGGAAALEVVAAGKLPVLGFVSLCPPVPGGLTADAARAAAARGVRGSLLTTERDGRLAAQRELAAVMREAGLLHDFVVTPDVGHWYPGDLADRIDSTLRAVVPFDPGDPERERSAVERAVRDSIGWALTKDRTKLDAALAHDASLFIFHPDSKTTVSGWDAFSKMAEGWMDPRFKATSFDVRQLGVTFSPSRDVAWFHAILDDCGEWEGKPYCWKETRWTGVLERRDGAWTIAQMHFSFASDKVKESSRREALAEAAVARCARALGGAERIASLRTLRIRGVKPESKKVVTNEIKRPNRIRSEAGYVLVFDGHRAGYLKGAPAAGGTDPGPTLLGKEEERDFELDIALLFPAFFDQKAEHLGTETLDGKPLEKLGVTLPRGIRTTYYLDAATALPERVVAEIPTGAAIHRVERRFADYREAGGVLVPRSFTTTGWDEQGRTEVTSVELDVPLADDRFEMPPGAAAPAKER